jgi:hypothetical protein
MDWRCQTLTGGRLLLPMQPANLAMARRDFIFCLIALATGSQNYYFLGIVETLVTLRVVFSFIIF